MERRGEEAWWERKTNKGRKKGRGRGKEQKRTAEGEREKNGIRGGEEGMKE